MDLKCRDSRRCISIAKSTGLVTPTGVTLLARFFSQIDARAFSTYGSVHFVIIWLIVMKACSCRFGSEADSNVSVESSNGSRKPGT